MGAGLMKASVRSWYCDSHLNTVLREALHLDEANEGVIDWEDVQELFKAYNIAMLTPQPTGTKRHRVLPHLDVIVMVVEKNERFTQR